MPDALSLVLWIAIALLGGMAAILGSLMTLGTLLLWLVPARKLGASERPLWPSRLKLLGIASAIALFGILLLWAFPFPFEGARAIALRSI